MCFQIVLQKCLVLTKLSFVLGFSIRGNQLFPSSFARILNFSCYHTPNDKSVFMAGGLVKKILETKKDYESSKSVTKHKDQVKEHCSAIVVLASL